MTLEKAIEILTDILHYVKPGDPPDEHDAVKLGIEALRRVRTLRAEPHLSAAYPLPSEDEQSNRRETMKLEKAIEILTIHNDHNPNFTDAERREAHQLGIEALKGIKKVRKTFRPYVEALLPGETED